MAIRSILRIVLFLSIAIGLCACGRSELPGDLAIQLSYPSSDLQTDDGFADSSISQNVSSMSGPAAALYPTHPSNRILIRILSPHFSPIEAWFERSEGRGVIRNVPPGTRISVEVDEYDNTAVLLGTNAVLRGRGWARGITLAPGETKKVEVAMYEKGTIVTICGVQGALGDSGDGGLDNAATIGNPSAVKAGPDDSIYISSSAFGKVKRIDRYGYVSHFAGNGSSGTVSAGVAAVAAPVGSVSDIDIDPSGNIYLFTSSSKIIKVTASGMISAVVYDSGSVNFPAWDWLNLAVTGNSSLYFVNYLDRRIYQIINSVKSDFVTDNTPYSTTELFDLGHYPISGPSGITYASKSNSLIFADTGNNRIMELSLSFLRIRYLVADDVENRPFSEGVAPRSMTPVKPRIVDYNPITGKIFFVEEGRNRVLYITPDDVVRVFAGTGSPGFSGDGGLAPLARLYDPRSITVDSRGNAYIADFGNHAIRMVVGGALP